MSFGGDLKQDLYVNYKMIALSIVTLAVTVSSSLAAAGFDPYSRLTFPNRAGLAKFDSAKFGLFIHWGPVSIWGTNKN